MNHKYVHGVCTFYCRYNGFLCIFLPITFLILFLLLSLYLDELYLCVLVLSVSIIIAMKQTDMRGFFKMSCGALIKRELRQRHF